MPEDPVVHMHLDLCRRGGTVCGQLGVDGAPARTFTGWIGLNAAIDEVLVDRLGQESSYGGRSAETAVDH